MNNLSENLLSDLKKYILLTEKINVKGDGIHPIYKWLTSSKLNGVQDSNVKWNFQKYFIDKNGHLVDFFPRPYLFQFSKESSIIMCFIIFP